MHKAVTLRYQRRALHFIAGPYVERIAGTIGVKLAAEIVAPHDIDLPIEDFETPTARELEDALMKALKMSMAGHLLYLGCMGGKGRTGMFLAALHRALTDGSEDSVQWVRRVYLPDAVETAAQRALVASYDVARVQNALHLDPDGKVTIEEFFARTGASLARLLRLKSA